MKALTTGELIIQLAQCSQTPDTPVQFFEENLKVVGVGFAEGIAFLITESTIPVEDHTNIKCHR